MLQVRQSAVLRRAAIEPLESRQMLTAVVSGPQFAGIELLGNVNNVTGVVLKFNEPLTPIDATDAQAYVFGKPPVVDSGGNGITVGDVLSWFRAAPGKVSPALKRAKAVMNGKIQFNAASYDPTTDSVTLTPTAPFKATAYFKYLRIYGTGTNALRDTAGNPFNGGVDGTFHWRLHSGKNMQYADSTYDHLKFKLTGPGKLYIFTRKANNQDPLIFIDGATSATKLTASVKLGKNTTGPIHVAQVEGAGLVANNLLNNASFEVDAATP